MKYAGFWIRFLASSIDDTIVLVGSTILSYGMLYLIYLIARPAPTFGEAFTGGQIQIVSLGASLAVGFAYYVWYHYKYGQTPGKRIFKIIVLTEETMGSLSLGRSVGRYFAHFISALPFGAGYIMAAWNPKKKALHDTIAGTVSVMQDTLVAQAPIELPAP